MLNGGGDGATSGNDTTLSALEAHSLARGDIWGASRDRRRPRTFRKGVVIRAHMDPNAWPLSSVETTSAIADP
jgi:hypothetical protein